MQHGTTMKMYFTYLLTCSVARNIQLRMVGRLVTSELQRIRNEAIVIWFEGLFLYLLWGTEDKRGIVRIINVILSHIHATIVAVKKQ